MKRSNFPPALWLAAFALIGLIVPEFTHTGVRADDNAPHPLPDADRQVLNQYLGNNVVGQAIAPLALPNGLNDLISLDKGLTWRMRVISGKAKGAEQTGSASLLDRPDHGDGVSFRFDTGDGRNVLFGQLDTKGNMMCHASQDNQEGVMSRFSPPQPLFLANLAPGEIRRVTTNVSVADLSRPEVETHSGKLDIEFQYVGAYRLHVPAGLKDAVLFKTHLVGKIGPAAVEDTIYRFFAKNAGPVAIVESNNVSAVLVYHEKTRIGKVLVETTSK